jgi:two-component system CheB/CheR fusion protein
MDPISPESEEPQPPDDTTPAEAHAEVDSSERVLGIEMPVMKDADIIPMIGLGGSAGSISPLQDFFAAVPPDLGISYAVVIHLSPDHESRLAGILAQRTSMKVVQVSGTVTIERNVVYVIPPGYHLAMVDGQMGLTYPEQDRGKRVAVDFFFRSLAATHRSKAMAVVLSGVDGDGAIGIKRIKEAGGVAVAQDPAEAEYEGMPRSAIETGMVDWILPISEMAKKVAEWARNEGMIHLPSSEAVDGNAENISEDEFALREILSFLHSRTGQDFVHYKRATVLRRIMRRLQVNSLADLPGYALFLRQHPAEPHALLQDLLISVTNFFRDPESFTAFEAQMPALFANRKAGQTLRIWVPGCATGEEPYSLMMLLLEHADSLAVMPLIQIFATDLNESALRVAREGYFPLTISADVSPERLQRFFLVDQGRYRIKKEIRDRVLFAPHNVLSDPPFSRLDLVSCRNLLIYFNKEAQERVLRIFHFSLMPEGLLFLGNNETTEESGLFTLRDKKHRIFVVRNPGRRAATLPTPLFSRPPLPRVPERSFEAFVQAGIEAGERPESERVVLARAHLNFIRDVAPASLLVSRSFEILHLSQGAGRFIRLADGKVTNDLLSMIHPSLRLELRSALFKAVQSAEDVDTPSVMVEVDGGPVPVSLKVRHPRKPVSGEALDHLLVIFAETHAGAALTLVPSEPDEVSRRLEEEIQHLRDDHSSLSEDFSASVEELRASNEELQATNEEHRSAVEELETSQEELQATNEELITVNQELKHKLDELSHAHSDLQNFISSSDIATLFLSPDLMIKRFTPRAGEIFRIIPADIGRALADLRHSLVDSRFIDEAKEVVVSLAPSQREIGTKDGKWYLLRISPYQMTESEADGVILTFVNITPTKSVAAALRQSEEYYRAIVGQMGTGVTHLNLDGQITYANRKFREMLGYEISGPLETGSSLLEQEGLPVKERLVSRLGQQEPFDFEKQLIRQDGREIWVHVSVSPMRDEEGVVTSAVALVVDITKRRQAERDLRMLKDKLAADLVGMTRLHELNERLLAAGGLDAALLDILSLAIEFTGTDRGCVQLVEQETAGRMYIAVHEGLGAELVEHFKWGNCEAVSSGLSRPTKRVILPDVLAEPKLAGTASLQVITADGIRSMQATPLLGQSGETVGVLTTASPQAGAPDEDAFQRLDLLAWLAGSFIERSRGEEKLRKSEAAMRESREHLQRVMESVRDYAIIICDPAGLVTGWNPGAVAMFRLDEEEAIGMHTAAIFTPEDREAGVPDQEMATARDEGHAADERWHIRKNGERFWVSGAMSPLYNGKVLTGYVKVARDLTEHRLAEAAVRDSEARFRTLADAVPQLVWTNNADGSANYFNQRWFDYTGLSPEQSEGPGWQAVVHPEDAEGAIRCWKTSLSQSEIFDTGFRLRSAQGEYRWFIGRNIPLRDEGGKVIGWFGTATDVENMKQAEDALKQSEERLRIALESAEMGAWDWDVLTDQVRWNDRHFYLLGLLPEDDRKTSGYFLQFVHPDDAEAVGATLAAAVENAGPYQSEFRIIRRDDGAIRWMSGYGRVVETSNGSVTRMTGVMYDSTERKITEEQLRLAHNEMELRVKERTLELSEALNLLREEAASRRELEENRHELLRRLVATQEDERRRISRELHDNLSQHMVAVKFGLDRLQREVETHGGPSLPESFENLGSLVDLLIKAAHRQAWELRPAELDHLGLETALERYVEDWSRRTGIGAEFHSAGSERLPPEIEIAFYRIVQESLTNVARHADCTQVNVFLHIDFSARVCIEDDGKGMDTTLSTGRLGLLGMRERMAVVGGTLEVKSTLGKGTTIHARVDHVSL